MADAGHSPWGASSAYRRIACPASFTAEAAVTAGRERTSSPFAAEGTIAHEIAERAIRENWTDLSVVIGVEFEADGHKVTPDQAFVDAVQVYVDHVRALEALDYDVRLEIPVSLDAWNPALERFSMFGTTDCVAVNQADRHVWVTDLKFGRGTVVEAEGNPQGRYYALGVLDKLGWQDGRVRITIVQPRADHPHGPVRSEDITVEDLREWARTTLVPAVERSLAEPDRFFPGTHCKFCAARAVCPALEREAQAAAANAFADDPKAPGPVVQDMDGPTLGAYLETLDVLEDHIKAVRGHAQDRLSAGGQIPGWKLVPSRAMRRWKNEDHVRECLADMGVPLPEFLDMSLKSPAQILKAPSVKSNHALVEALDDEIHAVSSGTTLARAGDPRPAVAGRQTASDAFRDD